MPASLEQNLRRTRQSVASYADAAGRGCEDVTLLAVTKSVGPETALALARLGQRDLGENRVPGLIEKHERFSREGVEVRWHFIGHIQRNKARKVVLHSDVIHSVDSIRLLETIGRVAAEESRRVEVYLEVKLSSEEEKHGLAPADLPAAVRASATEGGERTHVDLVGLMTMAARPRSTEDREAAASATFEELAGIARELEANAELARAFRGGRVRLSMGMSGDYGAAIAAGSNVVRIGSALFEDIRTDQPTPGDRP